MKKPLVAILLACACVDAQAQAPDETGHARHERMAAAAAPLDMPGNDAFAAIREVVKKLLADPDTDWGHVDLEALRRHLVDMRNFTLNVQVVGQAPIEGGVEFTVAPTTPEAAGSLERLFAAHPAILEQETGWEMQVTEDGGRYTARVTSARPADVAKIRGLGYIGIVALGDHHRVHHWRMATGADPHTRR